MKGGGAHFFAINRLTRAVLARIDVTFALRMLAVRYDIRLPLQATEG